MKKIIILFVLLLSACSKPVEEDCLIDYSFASSIDDLASSELIVYGTFLETEGNLYKFRVIDQLNYDINVRDIDVVINNEQLTESEYCAADEYIEYTVNYDDLYLLFLNWDSEQDVFIPSYQQFAFLSNEDTINDETIFIKDDLLGYKSGLSNEVTLKEIKELETING